LELTFQSKIGSILEIRPIPEVIQFFQDVLITYSKEKVNFAGF